MRGREREGEGLRGTEGVEDTDVPVTKPDLDPLLQVRVRVLVGE